MIQDRDCESFLEESQNKIKNFVITSHGLNIERE